MILPRIFARGMMCGWPDPVTIRRTWTWGLLLEMAACLVPANEQTQERRAIDVEGIQRRLSDKNIPPVDIAHLRSLGINVEYSHGN